MIQFYYWTYLPPLIRYILFTKFIVIRIFGGRSITMVWKEEERLGDRRSTGLMKNHMHYRSKELNKRIAFPAKEVGKRTIDAFNQPGRQYLEQPKSNDNTQTI